MVPRKNPLDRPAPTLPASALRVMLSAARLGPDKRHLIREPVTLIGSRRDGDFTLTHPDISKVHCAVVHTGRTLFVCDLRSRMGTYVNDHFANLAELQPGVALRLGAVPIEVEFESGSDAQAQAWSTASSPTPLRLAGASAHMIEHAAAVIGRRGTCDVVVDAPDISLAHALLLFLDGRPALFDLGSRSGTFVNDQAIEFEWLAAGDRVRVGHTEWRIEWAGPIGFDPAVVQPRDALSSAAEIRDPLSSIAALAKGTALAAGRVSGGDAEGMAAVALGVAEPDVGSAPTIASPPNAPLAKTESAKPDAPDEQAVLAAFRALTRAEDAEWTAIAGSVKGLARTLEGAKRVVTDQSRRLQAWADELAQRASRLEAREAALARREQQERATRNEIERFKKALQQAQGLFSVPDELVDGTAPQDMSATRPSDAGGALLVERPLFGQEPSSAGAAAPIPMRGAALRAGAGVSAAVQRSLPPA